MTKRKNKKIKIMVFILAFGICVFIVLYWFFIIRGPEVPISNPELQKLIVILDKYKSADVIVLIEGKEYKPDVALQRARGYLQRNFKPGDKAEAWVEEHAYRGHDGSIMYFKYPDGSFKPMRDIFLEELKQMENPSLPPTTETESPKNS